MANAAVMGNSPFLWEGTDRKGKKIKGKSMAANEAAVRADLRRKGVVPSKIRKQSPGLFKGGGTVTPADIAIFSRQLATMLAAGIPLVQAFEIVGTGHENAAMQKLIMAVKVDVEGGSALAEALSKHPLHFDDLFVNLVRAGEQAGAANASEEVLYALTEGNRAYEERFGYIFIVCATGKSADEMLDLLHARLPNTPTAELPVAAEEQRKITRLRLEKLLKRET